MAFFCPNFLKTVVDHVAGTCEVYLQVLEFIMAKLYLKRTSNYETSQTGSRGKIF